MIKDKIYLTIVGTLFLTPAYAEEVSFEKVLQGVRFDSICGGGSRSLGDTVHERLDAMIVNLNIGILELVNGTKGSSSQDAIRLNKQLMAIRSNLALIQSQLDANWSAHCLLHSEMKK